MIIDEFPWQISLRQLGSHICGGSLINDRQIVCAAHCVKGQVALLDSVSKVFSKSNRHRFFDLTIFSTFLLCNKEYICNKQINIVFYGAIYKWHDSF